MERNAGVDVKPGEEDGEGGVERALCKKSSKLEEERAYRFILSSSSSERRKL